MKYVIAVLFITLMFSGGIHAADNGVITIKSAHSAKVTIDRLEETLKHKGLTVALRWSHSEKAAGVGLTLRPTELIIFGNPKLGSKMFISKQTSGLDLPMKMLAWEDDKGQTWLSYNDPAYITKRHGITDREAVMKTMTGALSKFAKKAAAKDQKL